MAWLFVRLKLRLLAGSLKGDLPRTLAFAAGTAGAAGAALLAFLGFALLRGTGPVGTDMAVIAFTGYTGAWAVVPVFMFRSDETLDPTRLALLPLRPRTAAFGLLAAAATGVVPLAGFVALCGTLIGLTGGPLSVLFALAAVAVTTLLALLLGRIVPLALVGLLRSRRGSDVMILGLVLLVGLVAALQGSVRYVGMENLLAVLGLAADWLRWTPPGMAVQAVSEARHGAYGAALVRFVLPVLSVVLLGWWWTRLLSRALVSYKSNDGESLVHTGRRGVFGPQWLPSQVGAVMAKELRYTWREPRRKANWVTLALMCVCFVLFGVVSNAHLMGGPAYLMVMLSAIAALSLGANYFGLQGSALWVTASVNASARDLRAELTGAGLAFTVAALPLLAVFAALIAVQEGTLAAGLGQWSASMGTGLGTFGVAIGIGSLVSVYLPYALPERSHNPFAGPGAGQGLVVSLAFLGSLILVNLAVAPLYLAARALGPGLGLLPLGIAYGAAFGWFGLWLAGHAGIRRLPEILAKVSKPT